MLPKDMDMEVPYITHGRKTPKQRTWQSPFPLYIQYVLLSVELTGGVACGGIRRTQPFAGLPKVDMEYERQSVNNVMMHLGRLITETEFTHNLDVNAASPVPLLTKANALRKVTARFITNVSKPLNSNGAMGIGQLLAHHIIGILGLGGWIDPAHVLNASFSKGTGTCNFLIEVYTLNPTMNPRIIDAVSGAEAMERFGNFKKVVAENVT